MLAKFIARKLSEAVPPTPAWTDPAPPATPSVTQSPCLIMLGGLGDVLIALPIARHYAERFNRPTRFMTSARFQNVLAGCSYVESVGYNGDRWSGYYEAIPWARARFECVLPLHVGEPGIVDAPRTTRFCHEQYLHAGVEGRYGDFPLVFDRRDEAREARLVARVKGSDPRPLFLYNLKGRSSPFAAAPQLLAHLKARWSASLHLVDISALDLPHYQDLLALLDASVGALSIDTSTIHLMPASRTPYIALLNDTKTPWWQSVPRGACRLQLGYTALLANAPGRVLALDAINASIERMLNAERTLAEIVADKPVPAVAERPAKDERLVTLACNGMEAVWMFAQQTWKPYCERHSYDLRTLHLKLNDLHPSWQKLSVMLEALEDGDCWWIDSDITVAPGAAPLPASDADLLFATDWNGLCAAMFRARSTPWTRDFLRAALTLGDVRDPNQFGRGLGCKWEQNAFKLLLREFPATKAHVAFLPTTFLNDRPHKERWGQFYHFGARSNETRIAQMRAIHAL